MIIYGKTPKDYLKKFNRIDGFLKYLLFCSLVLIILCVIGFKGLASEPDYGPEPTMMQGMDSDMRNPGNDKIRCLKYEDCPDWDGNPDTKVYFDLMKLDNGSGIIAKSDFNWQVHLYSCHLNEMLDSINGKGSFEKRANQSAKDGWIPCPIGVNPHWSYDWELHILKAKLKKLTMLWPKDLGQMGRQLAGPQNSINMVE